MADLNGDATTDQAAHIGAVGEIAALHLIAEIVQDLGDAAHADAADADEMDGADREGERSHAACSMPLVSLAARARSARREAASGRPKPWAAAAAAARRCGAVKISSMKCARRDGVNSGCAMSQPAPDAAKARAFAV